MHYTTSAVVSKSVVVIFYYFYFYYFCDVLQLFLFILISGRICETSILCWIDICFMKNKSDDGAFLSLKAFYRSKTASKQEQFIFIHRDSFFECPLHSLGAIIVLAKAPGGGGVFTRLDDKKGAFSSRINNTLKKAAAELSKFDEADGCMRHFPTYTSHCYRHGSTSQLLSMEVSSEATSLRANWAGPGANAPHNMAFYSHLVADLNTMSGKALCGWSKTSRAFGYCPLLERCFPDPEAQQQVLHYAMGLMSSYVSVCNPSKSPKQYANRVDVAKTLTIVLLKSFSLLHEEYSGHRLVKEMILAVDHVAALKRQLDTPQKRVEKLQEWSRLVQKEFRVLNRLVSKSHDNGQDDSDVLGTVSDVVEKMSSQFDIVYSSNAELKERVDLADASLKLLHRKLDQVQTSVAAIAKCTESTIAFLLSNREEGISFCINYYGINLV